MDSDSAVANVLEVLVPTIAVAGLVALVVIAWLKGCWWMGVVGAVGFVVGFSVAFGSFGISEPSPAFQETFTFQMLNAMVLVALFGGVALLVVGVAKSARPGSWWDRRQ
jgi:uncharacterized membrane protein HdeD (DUF308 family)